MAKPIIDVSEHNGILNWESIKPQIDGAIIRCGYGGNLVSQDDLQYIRNVSECTRLNIPFGVYLFSYAENGEEANNEAEHVLRLVKGWKLSLPIYYDLEYSAVVGDLSAQTYTRIATAFCERIERSGGFVGIYSNLYHWQTKLYEVTQYTRWLAEWGSAPTYDREFKLWQYTSDGVINGSSARSDLSKWYDDFLTMVGNKNDFSDTPAPIPTPDPSEPVMKYRVGDRVSFYALYTSSTSIEPITDIAVREGIITKVIPGARNPYLINNGTGWVNDTVIDQAAPSTSTKYHIGDVVRFDALYTSSTSTQPIANIAVREGTITKIIPGARNPYLINNGTGWVRDSVIKSSSYTPSTYQVGDHVRVKQGATDYEGTPLSPFVYQTIYQVMQVNGNRIVIGNGRQVTAAMSASSLYHV